MAAGTIPAPMMSETDCEASSSERNAANMVNTASGLRIKRTATFVTIPRVPSEPMNAPRRSNPNVSLDVPPSQTFSPSASTTSIPKTWFVVTPNAKQCGPPAFSATLPPMVQARCDDGSGA